MKIGFQVNISVVNVKNARVFFCMLRGNLGSKVNFWSTFWFDGQNLVQNLVIKVKFRLFRSEFWF